MIGWWWLIHAFIGGFIACFCVILWLAFRYRR